MAVKQDLDMTEKVDSLKILSNYKELTCLFIIQCKENSDRKMQPPTDVLCGLSLFSRAFFLFVCLVISPQTALCSLSCRLLIIVVVFSGNEKVPGLGCTRVEYERHKIHAKLFFSLFRIDKYLSCWFIHAFSVFVEVHLCGAFNVLELGMTTCWGLLASLARFLLPQASFKAHTNESYSKRNV